MKNGQVIELSLDYYAIDSATNDRFEILSNNEKVSTHLLILHGTDARGIPLVIAHPFFQGAGFHHVNALFECSGRCS